MHNCESFLRKTLCKNALFYNYMSGLGGKMDFFKTSSYYKVFLTVWGSDKCKKK